MSFLKEASAMLQGSFRKSAGSFGRRLLQLPLFWEEGKHMNTVRIAGSKKHSSVNGPGVRYVLFLQGCPHHCPGCQNPETHDPAGGTERNVDEVIQDILQTKYLDGLTFSGGDPLMQPEAVIAIAGAAKKAGLNIWLYTGWTFEQIQTGAAGEKAKEALMLLDVLVDGPFVEKRKTGNAIWRGSDNQRLIDAPQSLKENKAVELP